MCEVIVKVNDTEHVFIGCILSVYYMDWVLSGSNDILGLLENRLESLYAAFFNCN